jgi:hypothetical protein
MTPENETGAERSRELLGDIVVDQFLGHTVLEFTRRTLRKRAKGLWMFAYTSPSHIEKVNMDDESRERHLDDWNWFTADQMNQAPPGALTPKTRLELERMNPETHMLLVWSICLDRKKMLDPNEPDCIFQQATVTITNYIDQLEQRGVDVTDRETEEDERAVTQHQMNMAMANMRKIGDIVKGSKLRTCAVCGSSSSSSHPTNAPRLCGSCKCIAYCGKEHQQQHWGAVGGHKAVCKALKAQRCASKRHLQSVKDEWKEERKAGRE